MLTNRLLHVDKSCELNQTAAGMKERRKGSVNPPRARPAGRGGLGYKAGLRLQTVLKMKRKIARTKIQHRGMERQRLEMGQGARFVS